jgi:predicted amino acid-binding ACT domain protein
MESKRLPKALLAELEEIADVACDHKQAIVCLVGEDIHGKPGIAASVFNTIAAADVNIRMISQGASELNISFVIKEGDVPKAVQHLHAQFFPASAKTSSNQNNGSSKRERANGRGSVTPRARAATASANETTENGMELHS